MICYIHSMITNSIDPFSIISTAFAWIVSSLVVLLLVLVVAGVSACFGARFHTVFVHGLWALAIPVVLFLYGCLVERNLCRVKHVEISSENVPPQLDGYRIVQISDFHLRSYAGREKAVRRVVERINAVDADVVLFTGDLVTGSSSELDPFVDILSQVRARQGVYSVMGNHDYMLAHNNLSPMQQKAEEQRLRSMEAAMGWHLLSDSAVNLPDGLSIAGVENITTSKFFPSKGNLAKALSRCEGQYVVLMMHDPTVWSSEVLGKTAVDLTLSGHTHAAQISIFGWSPGSVMYSEVCGLYSSTDKRYRPMRNVSQSSKGAKIVSSQNNGELENFTSLRQYIYVNPGLGETGFMARIGIPPEVTVITLKKA